MAEKKHRLLKAAAVTAAAGAAAYAGTGYYIFRNAFDLLHSPEYAGKTGVKRLSTGIGEKNEWFAHCQRDDEFLDSYDGLKLHALRITNLDTHKWIILQHGLCNYSGGMLDFLYEADHRGYNILAPDARGCGMSEGRYTGLGWNEHYDLISWINHLLNIDPEAEIALYGINSGAAAVMNTTGDYLPANVKCAVEDGGFSGIKEIILHQIKEKCGADASLLLPSVDLYVRQFLHFSMNDVSLQRQLKQSVTPTLFVHGTEDETVPASMVFDNYYSCAAEKELYTVEGCGFAETYLQEGYFDTIFSFIAKYM